LLEYTIHMCIEEQVALFLNIVGHNLRNRLVATNFDRSGKTVSVISTKCFEQLVHLAKNLLDHLHWTLQAK
jgi:hypothetical protein